MPLFLALFLFRSINSLLIATYYDPDEYWQSLEIAHSLVFNYGFKTWDFNLFIRSAAYPSIFALIFKFLESTNLDDTFLFTILPKLASAFFAALADYYSFKLTLKLYGNKAAYWALFASLISWYNFFALTRSLSNNLESIFTLIAFYYWPWSSNSKVHILPSLIFASIACIIRPTAVIIWLFVGLDLIYKNTHKIKSIVLQVLLVSYIQTNLAYLQYQLL